ncbi:hypothetical protein BJ165DRAFT_1526765 [Panaeolus papilionaceus]|nr:hypothetical protein BJ165DRAFT_1526765 [Panaeolus papilionaceus]
MLEGWPIPSIIRLTVPFSNRTISEDDLVNLEGKVAIVTGGNTGGAKVYIAARNESKALAAIDQLKAENIEKGSLEWLYLNLSNPRLAKRAAEEFLNKETRLNISVNNAAIVPGVNPFSSDKGDLLDIMVINHTSHYVFTSTLLPLIKQTAPQPRSNTRIVNVTSVAHDCIHPTTLATKQSINKNYGDGVNRSLDTYGLTKLANILHTTELQRTLNGASLSTPKSKITCLAAHPGFINNWVD